MLAFVCESETVTRVLDQVLGYEPVSRSLCAEERDVNAITCAQSEHYTLNLSFLVVQDFEADLGLISTLDAIEVVVETPCVPGPPSA